MPKLVKLIHDLVALAIDKGVTEYISHPDIDNAIHQGQILLYRELVAEFAKTKKIRNNLLPFERFQQLTVTPSTVGAYGSAPLPTDFDEEIEFVYPTGNGGPEYPINIEESGFFRIRLLDTVAPPTISNPQGTVNSSITTGKQIQVAPITITSLRCRYWIIPPPCVYVETDNGLGQLVYNDTASTDVLWSAAMLDILMENTFKIIGMNLRDFQVMQAGGQVAPKIMTV